jgi:hypothetical protein
MYFPLSVSIPEPCHEDWGKMTPVEFNQRHCQSCEKVVTDFTNMSDVQIGSHLRRHEGKLCGRFRPDQLGRTLRIGGPRKLRGFRAAAAAAALLFAAPALTQTLLPHTVEQRDSLTTPKIGHEPRHPPRMVTIKGTIKEEGDLGYGLIGAPVLLKGTTTGTVTDIDGNYQLKVPADQPATLVISYPGFKTAEKTLSIEEIAKASETNSSLEIDLTLLEPYGGIAGGIVISYRPRPSLIEHLMAHPVKPVYTNDTPTGPAKQGDWKDYWREKFAKAKARRTERRDERRTERQARKELRLEALSTLPPATGVPAPSKNISFENPLQLKASPNPFIDNIKLEFRLPKEQGYTLELLSSAGKLITSQSGEGVSGVQQLELQHGLAKLPSGTYFLRLSTEEGLFSATTVVR